MPASTNMVLKTDEATSTTVPCDNSHSWKLRECAMNTTIHKWDVTSHTNVCPIRLRGFPTSSNDCITTQAAAAAKTSCGGAAASGHRPASHTASATVAPLAASCPINNAKGQRANAHLDAYTARSSEQWMLSPRTRMTAENQTQSP